MTAPRLPEPAPRSQRIGFRLFAFHLFGLFSIALSNALLALSVLTCFAGLARGSERARFLALPARRRLRSRRLRWFLAALAAYAVWLAASIVASHEPGRSVRALSELFTLSAVLVGLATVRGEKDARWIVQGVILAGLALSLVGVVQYVGGDSDLENRIRGTLSHYMTFSGLLLIADLLLIAQLATGRGWRSAWRWAALLLINVALLGSYTRSAWVAIGVAVLAVLAVRARRWLIAVPLAGALLVLLAPLPVVSRFASIVDLEDESNYDRICMARAGLDMIAERPVFGLGPDEVERRYSVYRHPSAPRHWVPHLHNSFLQLAAERGLPALAFYFALTGLSAAAAWRGLARLARRESAIPFAGHPALAERPADLYLGALLVLLGFNLAGLFENNWGDTEVQRLALLALLLPFVVDD